MLFPWITPPINNYRLTTFVLYLMYTRNIPTSTYYFLISFATVTDWLHECNKSRLIIHRKGKLRVFSSVPLLRHLSLCSRQQIYYLFSVLNIKLLVNIYKLPISSDIGMHIYPLVTSFFYFFLLKYSRFFSFLCAEMLQYNLFLVVT